ncbi:hypothetical protein FS595_19375 [Serratia rubidaea]|nr:hypothetical protein FS596_19370 [Serratia rubidaea]UJD86311.1 hypothetical protein FS595_19375 [Serratia rubidaea]
MPPAPDKITRSYPVNNACGDPRTRRRQRPRNRRRKVIGNWLQQQPIDISKISVIALFLIMPNSEHKDGLTA